MVLSDGEIWDAINQGELRFTPNLFPGQVGPSSIDLRLGSQFTTFPKQPEGFDPVVDLKSDIDVEKGLARFGEVLTIPEGEAYTLHPGAFVLAYTLEEIQLSNSLAARVEGRSSFGRLGISIHQTAPTVHATFRGRLRLEISHNGPFACRLYPGSRICQLIIERLGRPSMAQLSSRFQGQG